MPRSWVFAQFTKVDPNSKVEIIFLLLRYWRLHHNWDMQNAFVFDVGMESKHIYEGERSTNVTIFLLEDVEILFPQWNVCLTYW